MAVPTYRPYQLYPHSIMLKLLPIFHSYIHLPNHTLSIIVHRTHFLLVLLSFDFDLTPVILSRELDLPLRQAERQS